MSGGSASAGATELAERVVGELEDYQRRSMEALRRHETDPEAGIRALVGLHLAWTEEDPDRARMISRHRNEVAAGPFGERLAESNREWFGQMKQWIDSQASAGRVKPVSFNLLHAVVFAPTQEIAKLWLAGRLKRSPAEYADSLGNAAVAAVLSLPSR
jgi:hypothetical protein